MQAKDLDLRELLSFRPEGGVMHFMGRRVLLFDAEALGLLRTKLIESLGGSAARSILTRFGYSHGKSTAQSLQAEFPSLFADTWTGPKLHMLHGLLSVHDNRRSDGREGEPLVESFWEDSYEAEQHLMHLGLSEEPVCWSLAGFASGYVSHWAGRDVFFIETRCRGKGDAACHIEGRYREEWGKDFEHDLAYYNGDSEEPGFRELTGALREAEKRLKKRQRQVAGLDDGSSISGITAKSEPMRRLIDLAQRVAKGHCSVIVTGESGAGKERVARLLHDQSPRAGRPFVAVNCGALTETLLESELFGHVKGSFTGADKDRIGLFEAANGGTLFLDEIGEMPASTQVKLLRVLQEREVMRVGESKPRPVDIRVVAATNRYLAADVEQGRFRKDLYFRLRVVELRVPPLRERRDDILPLARIFLEHASRRAGGKVTGLTPQAADQLLRHEWPGNVRELQNAMEHAVALCGGSRADIGELPEELRAAPPKLAVTGTIRQLADVEREYILAALQASGGNRGRAAAELGIGIATLYRKLATYHKEGYHG